MKNPGLAASPVGHHVSPPSDPHAPEVLIVIPVYNHAGTLRDVATRTLEMHDRVLVVDDGSSDKGAETLEGLDVEVIRHRKNLGKGAAILSASKRAVRSGMTHIITVDADSQHDPEDIRHFLPVLRAHPDAIVVGKRDLGGVYVPTGSRVGRAVSNFWLRLETGRALGDAQSGFRSYPVHVLENLRLRERRYTFEIEVLVRAAWAGVELREVEISTYYPPPGERVSHFHLFWDNVKLSLLNASLTIRAMIPLPHRKIKVVR